MTLPDGRTPREVLEDELGIRLDGPQGNAWAVLGLTRSYLREAGGFDEELIRSLMGGARDGDYEHLLEVCAKAVLEV